MYIDPTRADLCSDFLKALVDHKCSNELVVLTNRYSIHRTGTTQRHWLNKT